MVIGAGTMGNGIAQTFATYSFEVSLVDVSANQLEKALKTIQKNLSRLASKDKIEASNIPNILSNITTFDSFDNIVSQQDLIIEAATENPILKAKIFQQIAKNLTDNTIVATNTSSISITKLAAEIPNPKRFIGMHFMNPVPIMKLVEIIKGYDTSNETIDIINNLSIQLGKTPVIVDDKPGFVANRILMPMINEAIYTLDEGVAGVSEIDTVMQLGMAHKMGPLLLADFIGLDVCLSILNVLFQEFGNPKYAPCPLLVNMVNAKKLGVKTSEGFYKHNGKEREVSSKFL